ncbi:hypothetical protein ASG17_05080 [Brevundimonas sp. Leaf363]|uniref:HAAS signaling domain-containing protein n=1 Tax=Brevundimonas sp. Leaf363 TaxID=1736353 RepID=UPI0006F51D39|nr:hypothetical protein [Brevundimonas sp. Leaf363]KQS55463.1 hypothetical protein ASG17_05080 [Brevundimonas sp. Leaf363]
MSLLDRYLNAVAAQLPRETRDDIIAELRDELETTLEAKAAEKGAPLTDTEVEAVLRDMGHPLAVAARFGAGPNVVVGPELYPWWMFGVRAALTVMVFITAIGALVRVLVGDVEVGQAIGQGFHSLFTSGIAIVGLATIAAFIIERQATKPEFLTKWRVKDLSVFEWTAFGADGWAERLKATASGTGTVAGGVSKPRRKAPPTVRAAASAFGWTVVLLWWTGVLGGQIAPAAIGAEYVENGFDWGVAVARTVDLAYWPVVGFIACRIVFDALRVLTGSPVRLTALGDIGFAAATAWGVWWVWMWSPISGAIRVESIDQLVDRVQAVAQTGGWSLAFVLMLCATFAFIAEVFRIIRALAELTTGQAWSRD